MNIYLIDPLDEYFPDSVHIEDLDSTNPKYFELNFQYRKCLSGNGREEFNKIEYNGCDSEYVEEGLRGFVLKVDCEACVFKTNPKCYAFNICIYNQTQQSIWCEENFKAEDFRLRELDECPI